MNQSFLDSPAWHRASNLTERLRLIRSAQSPASIPVDAELGAETYELWRTASPFDRDSYFAQRLAMDGLTEQEFRRLLGARVEAFSSSVKAPNWAQTLARAYSSQTDCARQPESLGEIGTAQTAGFLHLVEPLMADAELRLREEIGRLTTDCPAAPFNARQAVEALFPNLAWQLLVIIGRTMVLELNVARLEGVLNGATPPKRFASFTERLRRTDVAFGLLTEYPVLARKVVDCTDKWVRSSADFLRHLATRWLEIRDRFSPDSDPGALVEARAGAGDAHRGGRSVLLLRFAGGLQLVYKPRSLAVDAHFQDFIRWVNERGAGPLLRPIKVLDGGDHGWVEFVHAGGCASAEEVSRFYQRQGEYLAILYVMEATDFHFENLLACGEHPVLVDLEALFHPWVRGIDLEQPDVRMVSLLKARSVIRTGLLPRRTWAHDDYVGLDLSGLGAAAGQVSDNILQWEGVGTDEMSAVKRPIRMPGAQNRPTLDGAEVDVESHTESIVSGFSRMYELLRRHREELLSSDGPISRFADDEVRVVVRATRGYALLVTESQHPDYLRDALDLDRLLDRLWAGVDENAHLLPLIKAERADLAADDIPLFTTRPASKDLFTSRGEPIRGFFEDSGMALSRAHIQGLNAEDLRRQVWFIKAAIATVELDADELKWTRYEPVWPATMPSRTELRAQLIEEAYRIGDQLYDLALSENGDGGDQMKGTAADPAEKPAGENATWIGFAFANKTWSLDALLEDLYAGSSGVILSMAYLGSFGSTKYTGLARRALNTLRIRLRNTGRYIYSIGAFNGWGGIIYALSHLGALWKDSELLSYAGDFVDLLPPLIEKDDNLDVVGGCAGCIGGLLSLNKVAPSEKIVAAAIQCGDRLVATARPMDVGIGWFTRIETDKPITGFSHGSAGIAWALSELAAATGIEKYSKTALDAILFEHTQYSSEARNWLDNAGGSSGLEMKRGIAPSMAWCYGAPGIGLGRLSLLKHLDHPVIREDLELAVQATLNRRPGTNHSLCHGDLGNLDFLIQAAETTGDPDLARQVDELTNQILASMKKYGWLCGVPLGVESPALMNGLAGICFGLLRLADSRRVPSVLRLSPPVG